MRGRGSLEPLRRIPSGLAPIAAPAQHHTALERNEHRPQQEEPQQTEAEEQDLDQAIQQQPSPSPRHQVHTPSQPQLVDAATSPLHADMDIGALKEAVEELKVEEEAMTATLNDAEPEHTTNDGKDATVASDGVQELDQPMVTEATTTSAGSGSARASATMAEASEATDGTATVSVSTSEDIPHVAATSADVANEYDNAAAESRAEVEAERHEATPKVNAPDDILAAVSQDCATANEQPQSVADTSTPIGGEPTRSSHQHLDDDAKSVQDISVQLMADLNGAADDKKAEVRDEHRDDDEGEQPTDVRPTLAEDGTAAIAKSNPSNPVNDFIPSLASVSARASARTPSPSPPVMSFSARWMNGQGNSELGAYAAADADDVEESVNVREGADELGFGTGTGIPSDQPQQNTTEQVDDDEYQAEPWTEEQRAELEAVAGEIARANSALRKQTREQEAEKEGIEKSADDDAASALKAESEAEAEADAEVDIDIENEVSHVNDDGSKRDHYDYINGALDAVTFSTNDGEQEDGIEDMDATEEEDEVDVDEDPAEALDALADAYITAVEDVTSNENSTTTQPAPAPGPSIIDRQFSLAEGLRRVSLTSYPYSQPKSHKGGRLKNHTRADSKATLDPPTPQQLSARGPSAPSHPHPQMMTLIVGKMPPANNGLSDAHLNSDAQTGAADKYEEKVSDHSRQSLPSSVGWGGGSGGFTIAISMATPVPSARKEATVTVQDEDDHGHADKEQSEKDDQQQSAAAMHDPIQSKEAKQDDSKEIIEDDDDAYAYDDDDFVDEFVE